MEQSPSAALTSAAERSLVDWTTLIYALHAASIVTGILGTATVIGAFLTGWPSCTASCADGWAWLRGGRCTRSPARLVE
jgi:hypothetical protein